MNKRTLGRGLPRYRAARRALGGSLGALVGLLAMAASAYASVLPATPANLSGVLNSAQPGDTVILASGDYGKFTGAAKAGMVTIQPQPGAAATMDVALSGARNIRLQGLVIQKLDIGGTTNNVTVAGSTFTGMAVIHAEKMVNANIVFDGNTHANINVCGNCYEGRLQVAGAGTGPSGVTVQNSRFGPGGNADGMQIGAAGVQVLNNEFVGIKQTGAVHTDSLQLYGQRATVIRGNYFHDDTVSIMAPDGGTNELITDNVFVGTDYRPAVQLGSQHGTQFVHNTVRNMDVHLDRKTENPGNPSRDGVIRDNVFVNGGPGGYTTDSSYCMNCTIAYNLFSGRPSGVSALTGTPIFVGGANATTWAGFALANGSPGKGNASDGTDRGIRVGGGPAGSAAPVAVRPTAAALRAGTRLKLRKRITWAQLRRGLRVRLTVPQRVTVVLRLARKGSRRALVRRQRAVGAGTHTFRLRPRRLHHRPRKVVLRLRLITGSGVSTTLRRTIRVKH